MSDPLQNWAGDEASRMIKGRAVDFITRACITVKVRAQELLSVPGTVHSLRGQRQENAVVSQPGEPPRKQTGRLRGSMTYEVDEASTTGRVGTNLVYGKALELGTKRGLKPRPFLRRALAEMQANVNALLSQIGAT